MSQIQISENWSLAGSSRSELDFSLFFLLVCKGRQLLTEALVAAARKLGLLRCIKCLLDAIGCTESKKNTVLQFPGLLLV